MQAQTTNNQSISGASRLQLNAVLLAKPGGQLDCVPVSGGIAVPKGQLFNTDMLQVEGLGAAVAVQADVLNRWSDGSVRWMLLSFVTPGSGHVQLSNECSGVSRGTLQKPFRISNDGPAEDVSQSGDVLTTVKYQNQQLILSSRKQINGLPVERTIRLKPVLKDSAGKLLPLCIESVREEVQGSVRRVFIVHGRLKSQPFVTLQFRITHWVAIDAFQVDTRIRNARRARHVGGLWDLGDPGSFRLRELSLQCSSETRDADAQIFWKAESDLPWRQCSARSPMSIRQKGSGGRNWASPNHVTVSAADVPPAEICQRGYVVNSTSGSFRGYRCEPTVAKCGADGGFAVAVPEFWQQFPSAITSEDECISIGLFPELASGACYELQGGEQKTHTIWVQPIDELPSNATLGFVNRLPRLAQSAEDYSRAAVFPWFVPEVIPPAESVQAVLAKTRPETKECAQPCPADDDIFRLNRYLEAAISGDFSLAARRDRIDEYGWRNFGDIPADHEQTHYAGSNTVVSHYNNQFDLIFGAILQLAATGDLRWADLFDPLARHVMDIDIYHTDEDRAVFNGGLFWHTDHYVDARTATHRTYSRHNQKPGRAYGGGPSCEHNYTTGLLHYYFLTGHPEAREAVLSLAEWVIQMDDGRNTIFGLLDEGPTGHASATVFEDFHGPGRGAGNSVNAMLDAWLLTGSDCFLQKAEQLICRCVHPQQDLHALHLADAEGHWSYTVFLTALGRYLLVKQEADQLDAMYSYARETMIHYGRWMAVHEKRTLSAPEELQYPTEAWAAQDFRKANVLRLAATCESDARLAAAMRSKARDINNAAWTDLYAFGDAHLSARCLSILMTEGQRDLFHRTCLPQVIPPAVSRWQDEPRLAAEWKMFVPQKERVRQILRSPMQAATAVIRAINPGRCVRAFRALRRQM